jgi:hypothetical protein
MFPRSLFCVLLPAITGFAPIALADLDQDVDKAQAQLHGVLRRAISDLIKQGERDEPTIQKLSLERTRTEQVNYLTAYTAQQVKRGVRRSDAEANARETISRMVAELANGLLTMAPEVSPSRKIPP